MRNLATVMEAIISDFRIIKEYQCENCLQHVVVKSVTMPLGPFKGQEIEVSHGCKCEELQLVTKIIEENKLRKKENLYRMFDMNSLINDGLKKAVFENYKPNTESLLDAKRVCLKYVQEFNIQQPVNLLMTGTYGIGKSHLAVAIIKKLMGKGYKTVFISVPKLLTKFKSTYNKNSEHTEEDLLDLLENVDVLVLDDIGAEHGKEVKNSKDNTENWVTSKLFEIVEGRIGKHTIYTTNLSASQLQSKIGPRNFSRMMQDTEVIKMDGDDYRLKKFK